MSLSWFFDDVGFIYLNLWYNTNCLSQIKCDLVTSLQGTYTEDYRV